MNCRSITIHNNQEELISMPKKNCLGTGSLKWSCLDSKSKQHTKRFKLMKSELQDQALLGSVNLPNSEVNYKNVS